MLKDIVQKYDQRYHVFNNKIKGQSDQARLLLVKIFQRSFGVKVESLKNNNNQIIKCFKLFD